MLTSQVYADSWRINSNAAWNPDFPDINAAMADARVDKGDTLYIEQGATFSEVQTITKQVIVLGLGYDANQFDDIIIDSGAEGVKLMGLHIGGGIVLQEMGATIERCYVGGIIRCEAEYNCEETTVRCCFLNLGIAGYVDYYTSGWLIENNIIAGASDFGSMLLYVDDSTIRNNVCHNLYGISGNGNSVTGNIIFWGENDFFIEGEGNAVEGNMFSNEGSEEFPSNQYGYDAPSALFRCNGEMTADTYWFLADNSPAKDYEAGPAYGESPYTTAGTFPYGLPVFQKWLSVPAEVTESSFDIALLIQCFQPKYGDYPSQITHVEYFWDRDRGHRRGTELYSGSAATFIKRVTIDVSDLEPGPHTLYLRAFAGDAYTISVHQVEITEAYQWNDGDVFTAETAEGVEMTFQVISAQDKTCRVGANKSTSINKEHPGGVTIPATVNGLTVKELGPYAFNDCKISGVTIPNTVTTIEWYAFMNCPNLEGVTIPASVTSIGQDVFNNSFIPFLSVEEGNSVYDSRNNCNAIIETATNKLLYGGMYTQVPEDVTTIGVSAFCGRTGMQSIGIPNGVTVIESSAFSNSSLSEITLPDNLQTLGGSVFSGCKHLTHLTIPASVTRIGQSIVSNSGVKSLVVNSGNEVYDSRDNCNAIIETATNTLVVGCDATTIPSSVKTIGEYAFYMASFSSIAIPEGVTDIVQRAFNFCQNLESVTLPEGLKNIGMVAFAGSDVLTSITIPSTVTNIAYNAFGSHLTSIYVLAEEPPTADRIISNKYSDVTLYVPAGTKSKYQSASEWKKFANIEEVVPEPTFNDGDVFTAQTAEGVEMTFKVISAKDKTCQVGEGEYAKPCIDINISGTVTIPGTVKGLSVITIGEYAFRNCSSLIAVNFPEGLKTIEDQAFFSCSLLKALILPSTLKSIGHQTFDNLSSLTSIHIPAGVSEFKGIAFGGCRNVKTITVDSSNSTFDSRDNCNAIIETASNTLIASCQTTIIPSTVNTIGSNAFWCNYNLSSIIIPKSVRNISSGAFENCQSLSEIVVEDGNMYYDSRNNCNAIIDSRSNTLIVGCSTTKIPSSVTGIGDYAFYGCNNSNFTSISIPSGVKDIGRYAFRNCYYLKSVSLPSTLTSISDDAFSYCQNLSSINLPEGIINIGQSAFEECKSLKNVNLPSTLLTIGSYAFSGCSALTSITIPRNVEEIGNQVVTNCTSLTTIKVDSKNTYFDSRDNCNAIVKTATNTLIASCKNSTVASTVNVLGSYSFMRCTDLTSITLPNRLSAIESSAFYGCTNLKTIRCLGSFPPVISYSLLSSYNGVTLYVPKGMKDTYAAADVWSNFTDIQEMNDVAAESFDIKPFDEFEEDGLKYRVNTDWTSVAVIGTGSDFAGGDITIPTAVKNGQMRVTKIGSSAFANNSSLRTVTIPNGVTNIEWSAFSRCVFLTTVVIPSGIKTIPYGCFNGCNRLSSINLPEGLTKIETFAFMSCSSLKTLELPSTLTTIGSQAFDFCTGLTSIQIPASVREFQGSAFGGCDNVRTITVDESNPYFDSRDNCNAIIEIASNTLIASCQTTFIPSSVTTLGEYNQEIKGKTNVEIIPVSA